MDLQKMQQSNWKENCLNTVRLIAAISVMYNHVRMHLNVDTPVYLTQFLNFFSGVPIFFGMSGYLIWHSIGRSGNFREYAEKRFWRIYPELWCGVILSMLTIVILADQHLAWYDMGAFALTQGTFLQFWTPDSLRFYGCGTPNGSLWTICVIVQFYIAAYFLYMLMRKAKLHHWILMLMAALAVSVFSPLMEGRIPDLLYKLYNEMIFPYFWMFLLGVIAARYREVLMSYLMRFWYVFLTVTLAEMVFPVDFYGGGYPVIRCTMLFAGMLGLAHRFPKWNVKTDISYGIYIYHMVVVNAMIELGIMGSFMHLVIAMAISCVLAYYSAKYVGIMTGKIKGYLTNREEGLF